MPARVLGESKSIHQDLRLKLQTSPFAKTDFDNNLVAFSTGHARISKSIFSTLILIFLLFWQENLKIKNAACPR
jgi:hypothetical protein